MASSLSIGVNTHDLNFVNGSSCKLSAEYPQLIREENVF